MCDCIWKERYELAMKEIENKMRICEEQAVELNLKCVIEGGDPKAEVYRHRANTYRNVLSEMKRIRRVH